MSSRPEHGAFATTRWTTVLESGREDPTGPPALARLCEQYWPPLYTYARRRGYAVHDAQDLTQAFFAQLLEKRYVQSADPQRGRFRSFLLASFKHFLANEYHRRHARKRGGGWRAIPLDPQSAEARYVTEPPDEVTPEILFEREWARGVLERVQSMLRAEYVAAGKADSYERLKDLLTGEKPRYSELARELDTTESALRVRLFRMRRRFRELLEAEVAATVSSDHEVDDEIRHLIAAVAR